MGAYKTHKQRQRQSNIEFLKSRGFNKKLLDKKTDKELKDASFGIAIAGYYGK